MTRSGITALVLSFMTFALHANAEPEFPGAIQRAANMPCAPTCLLCHSAIPGTLLNLDKQYFGLTVLTNGVVPDRPDSFVNVIANLRAKAIDTDKDGKLDVDELAAGTNPSPSTGGDDDVCAPSYGCGAHVALAPPPAAKPALWWFAGALSFALLAARRRRQAAP